MRRTLLAVALLLTSVSGVAGCGSDDVVQDESRVENSAPKVIDVPDGPTKADCEFLDSVELDLLDRLYSLDLRDRLDGLRRDLRRDLRDRCGAASDGGMDSPEGDDVDRSQLSQG